MRYFIIAGHSTIARGIYEASKLIVGEQENVIVMETYLDKYYNLTDEVENLLSKFGSQDEVIVVTDLLGGSVNNQFSKYLGKLNMHIFTGMNLALLINLFLFKDSTIDELLEKFNEVRESSIVYVNGAISQEEDFL